MSQLRPHAAVFSDLATPALVIDATAVEANISRMAASAHSAGIALRPHAKTHKSPDVAKLQRDAGAIGIACATIFEAEDLARANLDNLLITSPIVGTDKVARLIRLHRRTPVMVVVDHPVQMDSLLAALSANDRPIEVLVDMDIGQARTGVTSVEEGLNLAKRIAGEPRLRFVGLQGFAGHVQHIVDPEERCRAADLSGQFVRALTERLRAEGLPPEIVSGSGTGASAFDLHGGPYTELQVGSYVFMDSDYGRLRELGGERLPYQNALFVLATVVSANRAAQVTVDAGTKALAVNGPPPDRLLGVPEGATYTFAGDEHGIIHLPAGKMQPAMGARVLIGATHCDPTVNLYTCYHVVNAGRPIERWPIIGHYAARATGLV
jgi:D-serine deaminase-like pyridoxal phosphate-dependent protein